MSQSWFYQHQGKSHGPVSSEKIKELARQGALDQQDLIWLEGSDPRDACPASAALDFANLPLVSFPAPDWLEDVAKTEKIGPLPEQLPLSKETPLWLEDMRLWFGLDIYAAAKTGQEPSTAAPQTGGMPDWLEGWIAPEEPKRPRTEVTGKAPPAPLSKDASTSQKLPTAKLPVATPVVPVAKPVLPLAKPVLPLATPIVPTATPVPSPPPATASLPTASLPQAVPYRMSQATFLEKLASAKGKTAEAPTAKPPLAPVTAEKTKSGPVPVELLAAKAIQETGFDLTTGQILDPEKFRKWQKSSPASQPAVSNESLFEVFRKSRLAIENWVDEDCNRPLVMAGGLGAIKKNAQVLAILQKHPGYGAVLQDKLIQHLEFMVENRKKYYSARARQGRGE
jgi:uncharacterized protein DUF4339